MNQILNKPNHIFLTYADEEEFAKNQLVFQNTADGLANGYKASLTAHLLVGLCVSSNDTKVVVDVGSDIIIASVAGTFGSSVYLSADGLTFTSTSNHLVGHVIARDTGKYVIKLKLGELYA